MIQTLLKVDLHRSTPRNYFTHQSFCKPDLVDLQFNVKVKNTGTHKIQGTKNRPDNFSLVCIFLLNGWELRNTLKFIKYIRFIHFTWTKKFFAPTNHIDTMFLRIFSEGKCTYFGLPHVCPYQALPACKNGTLPQKEAHLGKVVALLKNNRLCRKGLPWTLFGPFVNYGRKKFR